jgi:hypothetical protein
MSSLLKKNKFTNISNVLPQVVEKLGLDRRLNEQALLCLWPSLVSETNAKHSLPLYIDAQNVLLVAVQNSATAQELSFIKPKLINKLNQTACSLGLKIKGIRFDMKQFHSLQKDDRDISCAITVGFNLEEAQALPLNDSERDEIEFFKGEIIKGLGAQTLQNIESMQFSQRLINLIEKRIRLKKWHKNQNLPFCKQCQEPLFRTGVLLCHYCLQKQIQTQI